jgi:amino acid adenylation domain-containing protein
MDKKILHTVFEAAAKKFAHQTAVQQGTRHVSYERLNRMSNAMARCLKEAGVGRDVIVGIFMESSLEYIASIIGVMKAGGIFLPVDRSLPEKRLSYMLHKTVPQVVVCNEESRVELLAQLGALGSNHGGYPVVSMDSELAVKVYFPHNGCDPATGGTVLDVSEENLENTATPDDSSYIMYTSGSTGDPKAILGCYKSLSHFMHWEVREFALDEHVRVTQLAPVTFDASLRDIFVPLITGGIVCIPVKDIRTNVKRLIEWLQHSGITLIHCVPSLFRLINRELEQMEDRESILHRLRYILMSGEALYGRDAIKWTELMGEGTELVNLYGASETTLIKSFYRIKRPPKKSNDMIPVGYPISNTALLILKGNRLCEIGELGDIYIKTPFRTKGYYNDPELTKNSFVPNPLNGDGEDIVYKTGDMGRYLSDRAVAFIGRLDTQVKVNGIRIELNEIERALLNHGAIDEAVVVAQKNQESENNLVCYYTEKRVTDTEEIRNSLHHFLPPYMMPVFYVKLDKFPLNLNGKIDKRALPKPEELIFQKIKYQAPENRTEEILTKIWVAVLDLNKVGTNSPFFEIGGHSLKATRIVSRIYRELGMEVSLKDFFENNTIKKLALHINKKEKEAYQPILPVAVASDYELSSFQKRLWILDQMEGGSVAYNLPGVYLVEGKPDLPALRQAFETVMARHESLRTTFVTVNGEPRQHILDIDAAREKLMMESMDFSHGSHNQDLLKKYIQKEALTPFDLSEGPLFRVKFLKLAEDRHVIIFNIHHIISDGWSLDVLANDIWGVYEAHVKNHDNPLPPLKIQYKDYAAWQNDRLDSDEMRKAAAYWHHKFAEPVPVLDLPVDYPRPPVQTYDGRTFRFFLDETLASGLSRLAREQDASLFMVMLALLKTLFHRYTGQRQIIIGSPVAGRPHPDLENQVGFYVNILPLGDTLTGRDRFLTVLEAVKQTTLEAYDHQIYPFDRLVNELDLPRDVSRAPLFDVMLVFQHDVLPQKEPEGIQITPLPIDSRVSRFDLTFETAWAGPRIQTGINYNTALFNQETIERLSTHFTTIVESVLENPVSEIKDLNILGPGEKETLICEFNQTQRPFPKDKTLVDLFREQADKNPGHIALIHGDYQLSYKELRFKANGLAISLVGRHHVKREELIGLMVDRNSWRVVGLMGILMSGGAYLPIDPSYPQERIIYMLEDSGCRVLLTEQKYMDQVKDLSIPNIVALDTLGPAHGETLDPLPSSCDPSPDSLAYVIYTSGSTGKPKGVMIEHGGFVNMSLDQIRLFGVSDSDRVLQFASASFDASLSEIFMALLSGGAVVLIDKETIDDPQAFVRYLEDKNVTNVTFPPVYLNALNRPPLETVRTIITAGEPAIRGDALFYSQTKNYFNGYGPTEISVCASVHQVSPTRSYTPVIPIGKPLANTRIFILDPALNLVPAGLPGEICIGGAGLARGYRNQPDLTRGKFIDHSLVEGGKLYRTGDLGKWLPDGNIAFMGRKDEQVKIRGVRIELGEIENTLLQHPSVTEAMVLPKTRLNGVLAAYIVSRKPLDTGELKSYLGKFLTTHMIPDYFLVLDCFPLTPNGKIDKKALPDPDVGDVTLDTAYAAPGNDLEKTLVSCWTEVLGKEKTGIHDNFFDCGGNSLHAIKLITKISTQLGLSLSVKMLFLNPTVAELSKAIETSPRPPLPFKSGAALSPVSSFPAVTVERRPLLSLFATGKMAPVDSATLTYFADDLIEQSSLEKQVVLNEWCHNLPVVSSIIETSLGRIATIGLPCFSSDLYTRGDRLVDVVLEALEMAGSLGARTVSLTGLIPSATDYGRAILSAATHDNDLPAITTGHTTTTATVILTIEKILNESGRELLNETVGFLGLGSVGTACLRLLLGSLPHPKEIILCDVYQKRESLEILKQEVVRDLKFKGIIKVMASSGTLSSGFYNASLILGATNVPDILDMTQVKPGTMIVDDSGPHCFITAKAIKRLEEQKDILFTEGGVLHCPSPSKSLIYLPHNVEADLKRAGLESLLEDNPHTITGCMFSGLLSSRFESLRPVTGSVEMEQCQKNYETLTTLGFKAAPLHCEDFIPPTESIRYFRDKFGFNKNRIYSSGHMN